MTDHWQDAANETSNRTCQDQFVGMFIQVRIRPFSDSPTPVRCDAAGGRRERRECSPRGDVRFPNLAAYQR